MSQPARRFTKEELLHYRDATVPDLVGDRCRLVFVGINPSLWSAATGTHFTHPTNRFYPALFHAGITSRPLPRGVTHSEEDTRELTGRGVAITNVVARATVRASDLSRAELQRGAHALVRRLEEWEADVVAVAGITVYREAFGMPKATVGRREEKLAGARLWVVPNPSGLNAHETVPSLAAWYRRAAAEAGIL